MKKLLKTIAVGSLTIMLGAHAFAAEGDAATPVDDLVVNQADSLEELLRNIEQKRVTESREHTRREQVFTREKDQQARMLADAQAGERFVLMGGDCAEMVGDAWKLRGMACVIGDTWPDTWPGTGAEVALVAVAGSNEFSRSGRSGRIR